jgi:hypothetical protein
VIPGSGLCGRQDLRPALSSHGHGYYAQVKDGKNSKRAALSEGRKACHMLAELGDALAPA